MTTYYRLQAMEAGGFVKSQKTEEHGFHYWTLGNRGFNLVRGRLPELQNEGYLPQAPYHDLIAAAALLGDWVTTWPPHATVYSEQQLRSYHPDFFPPWFSEFGRNSDGFWRIEKKGRSPLVIALEVELTHQGRAHYHDLAHRYGVAQWIDRVVWIASCDTHANSLDRYFSEVSPYRDQKIHNILSLNEFLKLGWRAKFKYGSEIGKSISDLLSYESDINTSKSGYNGDITTKWRSLIDWTKCTANPRL